MKTEKIYDCFIVGAGPAGLTAAIYCQRAGLLTAFIEKDTPGGKMSRTAIIENYPGFEIVKGYEISTSMLNQALKVGSEFLYGDVVSIKKEKELFFIETTDKTIFKSKSVIIATGMKERKLEVPGEDDLYGRGISYCAICDGTLFKGKDIAVIGGGNSALEESIYLSEIVNKIYLVNRTDKFRAESEIIKRVKENPKITIIENSNIKSFNGSNNLDSITIVNSLNQEESDLKVEGSFIFIGFNPITNFVSDDFVKKENGFIVIDEDMQTNVEGLYSIGDVNKKKFRQISTAVADGTIAALNVKKYLDEKI